MKRWIVTAAVLLLLAALLRPGDTGAPYSPFFSKLNTELKAGGTARPVLVLDLDILDQNIATLLSHMDRGKKFRLVAKSLPSIRLIDYICKKTGTRNIMVFHQPFINRLAERLPRLEMLLGKPMPAAAAQTCLKRLKKTSSFDVSKQIQWLIDNTNRLNQYLALAKNQNMKLLINIELDVGLHRGGLQNDRELHEMLTLIRDNPKHLSFSGFMGYEAHIAKAPPVISSRESALEESLETYNRFINYGEKNFPQLFKRQLTFNSAGSTTYQMYKNVPVINDISAGSGLVKPSDFDLPTLADHLPALFIATPVLKKNRGLFIPYLEFLSSFWGLINPNWRQSYFIYGGYWKAVYHEPKGLRGNPIYGHSSNQEIATSSEKTALNIDDFVFLRPTQSEAVMLQFGDIIIMRNKKIIDRWPVLKQ